MANTIKVDVVSAEEHIFSGEAEFVVLPGVMGELGIYPRHTPLFTEIRPGAVRMKLPNQEREELVFVQGGYLEVQPHHVTVLADTAIRAKDLDEAAALEAKKAAEEAMQNKTSKEEIAQAEAELSSALAQLEALLRQHHDAAHHLRMQVAEHAHQSGLIEQDGFRSPRIVGAEVELLRRRQRKHVVEDRVAIREIDGRAGGHAEHSR